MSDSKPDTNIDAKTPAAASRELSDAELATIAAAGGQKGDPNDPQKKPEPKP